MTAAPITDVKMGRTLLMAWSRQTATLISTPVWVRPVVAALSVDLGRQGTE